MVVLLGAGQSASPPFDVEPFVSGELAHLEHKLQHHREGTMQFLRMRGAGNPPPRSSAPPRPPDPTDLRRRLLIEKEETLRMVREKESEFRLELDKTLALFKCEMDKVMQNVLDQFRLGRTSQLTPPPNPAQPPKEHSSTPLSDFETAIPIVHSHLWKARCKEVARTTMGATGGVKKPHISRLGASTLHKTSKYRKLNFQSLAASLLFDDAISAQSNHNPTSFRVVSDTGTSVPNLNFVSIDCDGIDSVFVAKLNGSDESLEIGKEESSDKRALVYSGDVKELSEFEGVSVQQDGLQGPNLGENGRKCHALHLLDEMQYSDGLCNVGKHIVGYMGIRDKGGGLATHCLIVDEYFEFPNNKTTTAHLDCKFFVVSKHLCSKYKMARALAPSEAFTGVHGIVELDKVVVTMKKGEIALVIIFSENAVGALEAQPKWIMVPPNSTLCYASELVSVIVVKDQKIEVDGTEHEESNSHTINIKVGFDDRRTFYSACIGVQVHVEDVTTIASICFDLKDGAKIYKKLIMMAGIAYEFEKNFATIQEVTVASRNINLLAARVKSDDMKSGCQLWDNISVISCSRVTSWNPVRSCYFQNENHMEVHNALEAEISDIGNGFPLVLAPDIQDNKGEGGFIVNNQDVRAAVGVLDDGLMIMEADIADGDKELSISFFWNMCVYLLLPVLVKQPTLAASVTESLAYHINHQMEDKTVVHALLYEEGFNIEFFEKPKDITLEVLIESLQTHDDCVAVLKGLKDKSIDSELVGVIRDSWILKPKSVSVTWDWSKVVKEDSKAEIIAVLCKDAEGLSLTASAIVSSYFYGQTTTFMITFECKLVCKCLFQVAQSVPSTIAFKGLGEAATAAAKTAKVRDIAIVIAGIIPENITFDSGGYNIMTGSSCSIELMKFDMGSAAATLSASKAIVQPNLLV